jgi:uncharacterized protein (DUF488 family)
MRLWTVGHGNLDQSALIDTLTKAQIEVLVDVRSYPWSRRNPHFNQAAIGAACENAGVRYLWRESLGGKPKRRDLWIEDGIPDYRRMAREPDFERGIDELVTLAKAHLVAVMCSEVRPEQCHRTQLLTPPLVRRGVRVEHLLPGAEALLDVGAAQRLL